VREHVEHAHEAVGRLAPEAPVLLLDVVDPHALRAQVLEDGVPLAEVERVLADEDQPRPRLEVEEARVPDAEAVVRDAVDVHAGDAPRQALHEPPLGSWSLRGVRQHRRPGLAIQLGAPGIAAVHVRRDLLLLREELRFPCLDVIQAQAVGKIVWLVLVQERRDLHGIFAHFWCWPVFEKWGAPNPAGEKGKRDDSPATIWLAGNATVGTSLQQIFFNGRGPVFFWKRRICPSEIEPVLGP